MLIFSSIRTHPIFPRAPPRCAPSGRLGRPFAVGPLAGDLFLGSKDFVDVQDEQFDSPGLRSRSVNREATDISLSRLRFPIMAVISLKISHIREPVEFFPSTAHDREVLLMGVVSQRGKQNGEKDAQRRGFQSPLKSGSFLLRMKKNFKSTVVPTMGE